MTGNPRKNPVTDDQIVSAYRETRSVYAVERTLGVSASTIYRVLERCGVKRTGLAEYRKNAAAFQADESRRIKELYEGGASFAELAREFGGTEYSVKAAIKRAGGELKPVCPPLRPHERLYIIEQHAAGVSQMKISVEIGRSQSFVSRVLRNHGVVHVPRTGAAHGMWQGGRWKSGEGYMKVAIPKDDPIASMRDSSGYAPEHRVVMARSIGRPLLPSESVHHIDGDPTNNDLSNLQLRRGKHGKGVVLQCLDCGSHNVGPVKIAVAED